ncbi:hypothetical protein KA005_27315 [bacterium]|nr:hypothetical protein [bacterium]
MSCIVIRNKKKPNGFPLKLSDEARRRARKDLKDRGVDVDRISLLVWPEDAVSAYQKHVWAPWQYTTKADIRRKRQEDAKQALWFKREYGTVYRRALYVWAFYVPGFFFSGWWIYLVGIGHDYHGGGYKGQVDGNLLDNLLRLFPLVEPDLFETNCDKWIAEFVKRYQKGRRGGKPQGKALVWAQIKDGYVERILSKAELPNTERR